MSANDPERTYACVCLLGGRGLLVVPGRAQDSIRFQIALEARQYEWPAAADLLEHFAVRRKVVMGHSQFDLVLLLFDFQTPRATAARCRDRRAENERYRTAG